MDNCCHVAKLSPSADNSVLNPQNWSCNVCGTTESVWACLSCSNVACGRYISEHALKHYEESGHPLALEVNDRYVFCYPCGDYVLNDNAAGDIQVLRSCLHTISTRGHVLPSEVGDGHKRLLRSCSVVSSNKSNFTFDDGYLVEKDRNFTALCFRRRCILAKAFNAWRRFTEQSQQKLKAGAANAEMEIPVEIEFEQRELPANVISLRSRQSRGPVLTPGLTGLRNLGNTCYMNSILQTLSHIREFREYFIKRSRQQAFSINGSGAAPRPRYSRQTTVECFEHVSSSGPVKENQKGLIGGGGLFAAIADMFGSDVATTATEYVFAVLPTALHWHWVACFQRSNEMKSRLSYLYLGYSTYLNGSLSDELGALLRVMWSGKWAVISPHHILSSVWTALPFFRGYTQHDAQEFLSEFLDKIQSELASEVDSNDKMITDEKVECDSTKDIVAELFQGELVSQITCLKCGHCSRRREPFTDLSLDFPESYHATDGQHKSPCDENIHVHELLSLFTKAEKLDGPIYTCDACNVGVDKMHPVRTEATKQMLICRPPKILRLHLKRFMWGGRNSRGKISAHVDFNDVVDVSPFCLSDDSASEFTQNSQRGAGILYQLNGVVVHHGRGFGSGHYTAYCRNDLAGFWVNCNDSTVLVCERDDVHRTQAYILIYCQSPELAAVKCRSNSSSNSIKRARLDTGPYDLRSRPLLHIGIDD